MRHVAGCCLRLYPNPLLDTSSHRGTHIPYRHFLWHFSRLSYCWAGSWLIYSRTFSSSLFPSQTPKSTWSFLHSCIRNSEQPSSSSKMTFWLSWMNSNKQTAATNMTRTKREQCLPSRLLLLSMKLRATEFCATEKYARHAKLHQLWIVTVPFASTHCKNYKFFIKKEELWASQYSSAALTLPSPTFTWYRPPLPPAEGTQSLNH